jgi:DNA (cytosine-5)-methyltransferase 1
MSQPDRVEPLHRQPGSVWTSWQAGRPVLADLYCCAGGAAMGYFYAGFNVVGFDIEPQPNYPFEFVQMDALDALNDRDLIEQFSAIHASPPCQAYSPLNAYNRKTYPDLVDETRELLVASSRPWVMENVPQAPLLDPVALCGSMFGLRVYRHRHFEASFPLVEPTDHPAHVARCARNGYLPEDDQFMSIHGGKHSRAWLLMACEVMGVPWMRTIKEVCEAIPPVYTEYIGRLILGHLLRQAADYEVAA